MLYEIHVYINEKTPDHRFKMAFRSKKDADTSIAIESRHLRMGDPLPKGRGQIHLFPKAFGSASLKTAEPVPDTVLFYDNRRKSEESDMS